MRKQFVGVCVVGLFLAVVFTAGYLASQESTARVAVLGSVKVKTSAQDFESKLGATRAAREAEYKNAPGLVAVYRLKGSNLGVGNSFHTKASDFAYLELWNSANSAQQFWSPDGKGEGRGKIKEARAEVLKLGKVDFSCFDLEPVSVSAGTPKVAVLGSVKVKTSAQDFESKLGATRAAREAEYKNAPGLVAVYRLKGSNLGVGNSFHTKASDFAYLELWNSANSAQQFWSPDGKGEGRGKIKEARAEVLKLGKVDFSCFDVERVAIY